MGSVLTIGGFRAVIRQEVNVPEKIVGSKAVGIGVIWFMLGILFIVGATFDIALLKGLFKLFLEAEN